MSVPRKSPNQYGEMLLFPEGGREREAVTDTSDVPACDSRLLTKEIRPQTVPSMLFSQDYPSFCPLYVLSKNS